MERSDRTINTAADLGEPRVVSLDEALDALCSIGEPLETLAHRISSERDESAVLIVAVVDRGSNDSSHLVSLLGNGVNISAALAAAMVSNPQLEAVVRAALHAINNCKQPLTNENYEN